jgi:hypothetical protein
MGSTDELGLRRLLLTVGKLKKSLGHDPSMAHMISAGFLESAVKAAVRQGLLEKYQVQGPTGSTENRFKIKINMFTLNR